MPPFLFKEEEEPVDGIPRENVFHVVDMSVSFLSQLDS